MFKMKRMTALLMSVLLMGSTVCAPAMAAEVTGEEQGAVQEEVAKQEVALETEGEAAGQEVPPEEEPENAAENVTAEAAAPIEQGGEPEEAEEFDTSETAEEEQPETDAIESQESSGESTAETAVGTDTAEDEDEYLSLVVADGVTEDTENNDAYDASAEWSAEELSSLPVLDTDVSSASDGCVLLGMPGEFIADQQAFLDRINEIRREACEEGVINPSTGMPLTPEDYRPLKWSYDLEKVARIRAAESSMTGYHVRANGASWQSVECEPFYLGECIAWNYNKSATAGIRQWYGEKQYWVEGRTDKVTGHYTNMILPEARYVGGATFWSPYAEYPNTTLLEYSFEEGLDESFVDMTGECIQMLEVSESNLSGKPSIIGSASGVKGDENTLLLTENALYDGPVFSSDTGHLLFIDGVSWSSSNSGIASVSADGIVEARKCGSATITAQAENGSSADAEFTVEHVLQKMPAVDATCTKSGLTEGEKCSNCGKVTIEQETVPAKGHAYGSWIVTKEATCTAKGSRKKVCANCGDTVTEVIPVIPHSWNTEYTVDKEVTCAEEGSESIHCSVCGEMKEGSSQAIPKTQDHKYGDWTVTEEASCTKEGTKERTCTVCGDKVTESIPVIPHPWNTEYTVDKEANCAEEGSKSIHCSVCNAIKEDSSQAIPKTQDHKYGDWTVTEEASCTKEGTKERTCTVCGDKVTESIPVIPHPWNTEYTVDKEANCAEEGSKSIHCSVCNAIKEDSSQAIPKTQDHKYGEWVVTKEATCAEEGSESLRCTVCGEIKEGSSRSIPKTENHKYGNWTETKPATSTETGIRERVCEICGNIVEEEIPILKGEWIKNSKGWWYSWSDGSYPKSKFENISGKTYYFDASGYMVTGWQKIDGAWYYFSAGGAMQTDWQKIGGTWYYFNEDGVMQTGLQEIGGKKYYFSAGGGMQTGWQKIGSAWYYFSAGGAMVTDWQKIGNTWYYFNESGVMQTGWKQINGRWYYFEASGAMAANKWAGNYYLTGSGAMATNTWIGQYYVGADGKWIPGYKAAN